MTKCTRSDFGFPACKSRKIALDFFGGNITSNGGILLLKQADAKLGLSRATARAIPDFRRQASVNHTIEQMFRQRIYAIGCGEEDLNDHDELRHDIALQTAGDGRSLPKSSKIQLNLLKRSYFIAFFSFVAPLQESISYSCNIRVSDYKRTGRTKRIQFSLCFYRKGFF